MAEEGFPTFKVSCAAFGLLTWKQDTAALEVLNIEVVDFPGEFSCSESPLARNAPLLSAPIAATVRAVPWRSGNRRVESRPPVRD